MSAGARRPPRRSSRSHPGEPATAGRVPWVPVLRAALVVLVAGFALALRLSGMAGTARGGAIRFDDPDTLRRLVRLRHLVEPGTPYPYRDPADGWHADPARRGTVIHWTLPMDGVILALDRIMAPLDPQARRFEAGAAWSTPVLGTLAVVTFSILAARWLAWPEAILAASLYALVYDGIAITAFGSGDHPSLQHLCAVVALLGFLALLAGRGGGALATLAGAALGPGLWVSTETTVVLHLMAVGAAASLLVGTPAERSALARRHCAWGAAAFVVALIGDRLEHPGAGWTFEWDTVSGFQLHQLLVFVLFTAIAWRWRAPVRAALVAVAVGVLPFVLVPGYRATLEADLAIARAVNRWTQSEMAEYGRLFSVEGFFVPDQSWERFTWLIFALPPCLLGVALDRGHPAALRAGLVIGAVGLFGFTCYEVKLGHLFAIVYPLVLVVGGGWLVTWLAMRLHPSGAGARAARAIAVFAAVLLFLLPHHPVGRVSLAEALVGGRAAADDPRWDAGNPGNLLTAELRQLPAAAGERRAVLADWSIGAFILYETDHPVVASGYHRNLAGIRDAYRVFVARVPEDVTDLATILRERGVRWIITRYDPLLFVRGSRSFPELGEFGRLRGVRYRGDGLYDPILAPFPEPTQRTFLWRAHLAGRLTEPARVGDQVISLYTEVPRGSFERGALPNFIIYSVRGASDPE